MPQTATIRSLPAAFGMMKALQAEGVEWGEDYRAGARHALAELLEGRMGQLIDEHLERMTELGEADRRNGCYRRHLLTELGDLELAVPRTRTFSALRVVRTYARRAKDVDRMILACFVLGLSTRKVAAALLPVLGRPVSPATVSQVTRRVGLRVRAGRSRPRCRSIVRSGLSAQQARHHRRSRATRLRAGTIPPMDGFLWVVDGSPFPATGSRQFRPELGNNSSGFDDWVLLLESQSAHERAQAYDAHDAN